MVSMPKDKRFHEWFKLNDLSRKALKKDKNLTVNVSLSAGRGSWSGYGGRPRGKGIVEQCCRSPGCGLQYLETYCNKPKGQQPTTAPPATTTAPPATSTAPPTTTTEPSTTTQTDMVRSLLLELYSLVLTFGAKAV